MSYWAELYYLVSLLLACGVGISLGCWATSMLTGAPHLRPYLREAGLTALMLAVYVMSFYGEIRNA